MDKKVAQKMHNLDALKKISKTFCSENDFNIERDCFNLYSSMAGTGCDEEQILDILTMRTNEQRQLLRQYYLRNYKDDLAYVLSKNLGGNFNQLIVGLLMPTFEYFSLQLHKCILDTSIYVVPIVETIMTVTWDQWEEILRVYKEKYGYSLRDDLQNHNVYCIRRLLKLMMYQPRSVEINAKTARTQAADLSNGVTKVHDINIDTFNRLLALSSFEQLHLIFDYYEKLQGICIEEAVKRKFGQDAAAVYLTAIGCIRNSKALYANHLFNALQTETRNCKLLIRIICCRAEFDLAAIKEEYFKIYGRQLFDDIESTNIDYKRALCNLVAGVPGDVIYY